MVLFDWDPEKARINQNKHGIGFELAKRVWDDPLHVILPDRFEDGERRWHALGTVGTFTVLVVVHTYRGSAGEERIRIIGARRATVHERRRYEQESL